MTAPGGTPCAYGIGREGAPAEVPDMFCADRFHPSSLGYARWGAALARAASDILQDTSC